MCLTKYPLNEETKKFFEGWGSLSVTNADTGKTQKATDIWKEVMPAKDGSLCLFDHKGKQQTCKIYCWAICIQEGTFALPIFFISTP